MKSSNLKTRLGLLAFTLAVVGITGCSNNDSGGAPPAERKPGQDISPDARADKRGDVPDPEKPTSGSNAGTTAPGGK